ncbi:MAG: thiamine-phosphate kinase [Gammaproteobacteria bacterium]|nr:thiamine-phosphate kinase [Gammaproteobacteria bacterium]
MGTGLRMGEHDIIRRYFAVPELTLARPEIELGIGDDAAVLRIPEGKHLVTATDTLAEGTHFPTGAEAESIASRALAVNLSDLAAMAAEPLCFTLALSLPAAEADWLASFSRGLAGLAGEFRCALVGGDLCRGPLQVTIQIHGLCEPGRELRRSGARPGQAVFVTGYVGDGALGLAGLGIATPGVSLDAPPADLPADCRAHFHDAFYRPRPRIAFARAAAALIASAIDVSDGLLGDAGHLAAAGGVGIRIDPECLPYSPAALCCAGEASRLHAALRGGDDYELCFTAEPENAGGLMAIAAGMNLPLTRIGEVVAGEGFQVKGMEVGGGLSFDHFQNHR